MAVCMRKLLTHFEFYLNLMSHFLCADLDGNRFISGKICVLYFQLKLSSNYLKYLISKHDVIKDVWKFVNNFAKICQAYCGVMQAFPYDRLMFLSGGGK